MKCLFLLQIQELLQIFLAKANDRFWTVYTKKLYFLSSPTFSQLSIHIEKCDKKVVFSFFSYTLMCSFLNYIFTLKNVKIIKLCCQNKPTGISRVQFLAWLIPEGKIFIFAVFQLFLRVPYFYFLNVRYFIFAVFQKFVKCFPVLPRVCMWNVCEMPSSLSGILQKYFPVLPRVCMWNAVLRVCEMPPSLSGILQLPSLEFFTMVEENFEL